MAISRATDGTGAPEDPGVPDVSGLPGGGNPADYLSPWDQVHATITTHTAECRRIAEWAELPPGGRVLDMACGTGQHLIEFARRGHPCLGVDRLWWKLVRANHLTTSLGLHIPYVCSDLRMLRLSAEYDLVICIYAMSMMRRDEDLTAALTTAHSALSENGRFVFNVLDAGDPEEPESGGPQNFGDDHLRAYTPGEVDVFLDRAGFETCRIEGIPIPGFDSYDLNYVCRKEMAR